MKKSLLKFFSHPSTLTTYHLPLITLLTFLFGCQQNNANQVCFKNHCFNVEIVSTGESLQRGLQLRTSLPLDAGMLFAFPSESKHAFWMKDTLIPLDMIWINYSHRIVDIRTQVPPCQADPCPVYAPSQNALYVLEINAGVSETMGLKIGDELIFRLKE